MFNFTLETILAGFLGALVTGLLGYFGVVRKTKADETALALNAWKELLEPLRKELELAKEEIQNLTKQLEENEVKHRQEIAKLLSQIRQLRQEQNKQ